MTHPGYAALVDPLFRKRKRGLRKNKFKYPLFRKRKRGLRKNKFKYPLSAAGKERVDERSNVRVSK